MLRQTLILFALVTMLPICGWAQPNLGIAVMAQNDVTIGDMTIADWSDEQCIDDPDGCNDIMGQRDVQYACIASNYAGVQPADTLYLLQVFDEIGSTGANTVDGCWLIDLDSAGAGDGDADLAVCVTTTGNPAVLASATLYSCNDTNPDRCSGPVAQAAPSLSCSVLQVAECNGDGTAVECEIGLADLTLSPGAVIELLASCAFPSQQANSAPADCAFGPPGETVDTSNGNNTPVELLSFSIR